jgi:hypothetical protein
MKLSEFIGLPEDHKRSTVMTKGVSIASRRLPGVMVFLYQLHEYYIETYCCPKSQEILEYRVFENTQQLEPYLQAIRIDHLLN